MCDKQRFKEVLDQFLHQNNITDYEFNKALDKNEASFILEDLDAKVDIDNDIILDCTHAMQTINGKSPLLTEMAEILYDAIDDKIQSLKDIQTCYKYEYLGKNYIPAITKKELQKLLYNHRKYQIKTELWIESCHIFPRVICNDGFSFSAQAHCNYPCEPREELAYWEIMDFYFPSEEEPLLNKYLSAFNGPLKDTYRCVPMQVIADVINKHGGMKNIEDFRGE